jgi:hypothetical protein
LDNLNKATPRGEEGKFVRYARDSKGYLVWFPDSKSIHSHCDVEFHGFPDFLPSPALSEILWHDIPADLELCFHDGAERIVLEQPAIEHNEYVKATLHLQTYPYLFTGLPLRITPPLRVILAHGQPSTFYHTTR